VVAAGFLAVRVAQAVAVRLAHPVLLILAVVAVHIMAYLLELVALA
jgi:hypothetical protein